MLTASGSEITPKRLQKKRGTMSAEEFALHEAEADGAKADRGVLDKDSKCLKARLTLQRANKERVWAVEKWEEAYERIGEALAATQTLPAATQERMTNRRKKASAKRETRIAVQKVKYEKAGVIPKRGRPPGSKNAKKSYLYFIFYLNIL